MGPDPVPERGVELIIRPVARMAGRRHSKKHSQNHRSYLMKTGTCMRTFHIAQVSIHRDVLRDSDIQPMLKNLVMPLPNYDGSDVVLFPDETLQNLRFISGSFSLSNSRYRGKVGIDTISGTTRMTTTFRNNAKPESRRLKAGNCSCQLEQKHQEFQHVDMDMIRVRGRKVCRLKHPGTPSAIKPMQQRWRMATSMACREEP